jgi:cephalosporin-C deacetylase
VLAYFDSAVAATYLRRPALVTAALFDPAVPPPGQFCVYNALSAPKHLIVRPAAHFDWPGAIAEDAQRVSETRAWVARQMASDD